MSPAQVDWLITLDAFDKSNLDLLVMITHLGALHRLVIALWAHSSLFAGCKDSLALLKHAIGWLDATQRTYGWGGGM
jgi:hypothetical protein